MQASREGILIPLTLYVWAALHYLAAAFGLKRQLSRAAAADAAEALATRA